MEYLICTDDSVVARYTADDEEPRCASCDYYDACAWRNCGAEHGWRHYSRVAKEAIDKDELLAIRERLKLNSM